MIIKNTGSKKPSTAHMRPQFSVHQYRYRSLLIISIIQSPVSKSPLVRTSIGTPSAITTSSASDKSSNISAGFTREALHQAMHMVKEDENHAS